MRAVPLAGGEQGGALRAELFEVQSRITPWYHQHFYKVIKATLEAVEREDELEALGPWEPVKRSS
jgi:hypothetical protein